MIKKFIFSLISIIAVSVWLTACGNSEKGSKRQNGSNRTDAGTPDKLANQDIYEKNQVQFQECQSKKVDDLLSFSGLAKNTVEGKNLELILKGMTGKRNLEECILDLEKLNRDTYNSVNARIKLILDLMAMSKDLEPRNKYLFFESILAAFLLIEDNVLTDEEIKDIVEKQKQGPMSLFKNSKVDDKLVEDLSILVAKTKESVDGQSGSSAKTLQNELNEKLKSYLSDPAESMKTQSSYLQKISERIKKKDISLEKEYESISSELLLLSAKLEVKACTQMIIEKTDKKGDVLANYLQSMKLMVELESVKTIKQPKTSGSRKTKSRRL